MCWKRYNRNYYINDKRKGMKKFELSNDKVFLGVAGGFAKYFDVDVTLTRIIWTIIIILSAVVGGIVAYLICYAIMKNN